MTTALEIVGMVSRCSPASYIRPPLLKSSSSQYISAAGFLLATNLSTIAWYTTVFAIAWLLYWRPLVNELALHRAQAIDFECPITELELESLEADPDATLVAEERHALLDADLESAGSSEASPSVTAVSSPQPSENRDNFDLAPHFEGLGLKMVLEGEQNEEVEVAAAALDWANGEALAPAGAVPAAKPTPPPRTFDEVS